MIDAYVGQADFIGSDPERDRQARLNAVDQCGPIRLTKEETKLAYFRRLWNSDEAREYLRRSWAIEMEEAPDPVSLIMRSTYELILQNDEEEWGKRDRGIKLAATQFAAKMFIPTQTNVSKNLNLSAKIERPEQFDQEPTMKSRTILPAGQKITKPSAPTGADDDEDDEETDDDD